LFQMKVLFVWKKKKDTTRLTITPAARAYRGQSRMWPTLKIRWESEDLRCESRKEDAKKKQRVWDL